MPSAFAALNDALDAAVDGAFAEAFTILPFASPTPNGRRVADGARAQTDFVGIPAEVASRANSGLRVAHSSPKSDRAGHASARLNVSFVAAQVPYRPREGDRVRRVDTNELFEIAEVRPDGEGRLVLDLNFIQVV